MSDKKRLINDLRVIDLRAELEKRKLDKTGVRAVLIKRLSQHLKDEGKDPDSFLFDALGTDSRAPSKRGRTESSAEVESGGDAEQEPEESEGLGDVRVEDMIVQDDVGDEDEAEEEPAKSEPPVAAEPVQTKPQEKQKPEAEKSPKRKSEAEPEAVQAKKSSVEEAKPTAPEEGKAELNNTDAEDSINLDIGEDELLNDDGDSTAKSQKEGGGGDSAAQEATATSGDPGAPRGDADVHQEQQVKSDNITTSETADDKKEKDDKDAKAESEAGAKKEDGRDASAAGARNLWVSGLSGDTRAKDLKQLCSKHGKVIGAKVVTNARTPGSRCYGYVTMATAQDAENCIKNLHRTELHGRMISVEKAKSEASGGGPVASRRRECRHSSKEGKEENGEVKKDGEENGEENAKEEDDKAEGTRSRSRDKARSEKGSISDRPRRERSRERRRSPREQLSFNKIWKEERDAQRDALVLQKERDAQRARERSRIARDEERRRRQAEEELRERERRQRHENRRLAEERHKLRLERERIDREKKELLRLERERHKLEREKLELERLELKRAQLRLEEERRKRTYDMGPGYRKPNSPPPPPPYERDARQKRPPPPLLSNRGAFEAPPPPRFEMATPAYERSADKRGGERADYKREYNPRHMSSSNIKYASNGTSADDSRQPLPPSSRPKEPTRSTYESRDARSGNYRTTPPGKPEPRTWTSASRYPDSAPTTKDYERGSSGGSNWASTASKSYPSSRPAPSASQGWTKPGSGGGGTGESWQSSASAAESRYASNYESRSYPSSYQPPPPGAAPYVDRYPAAPARGDYRQKY